jgi:protein-tyrosine phosphatase
MSDDVRPTRVRGEPNADQLKRAKAKYKTYNDSANTEFLRLSALNNKKQLTPNSNPHEHATFHHLNDLRMQGDVR